LALQIPLQKESSFFQSIISTASVNLAKHGQYGAYRLSFTVLWRAWSCTITLMTKIKFSQSCGAINGPSTTV